MARCFQFSENGKPVHYKQMISLANLKSWSCRCKECTFAVSCFKTDNFKLYIDGVECVCAVFEATPPSRCSLLILLTGVIFNGGAPFITNMHLCNWQASKARHSQVIKVTTYTYSMNVHTYIIMSTKLNMCNKLKTEILTTATCGPL